MSAPDASEALADLFAATGSSQADRAVDSAVKAFRARAPPLELVRSSARAAASHFDPALGLPPHGLLTLACASNLYGILQPRFHPLPTLQAIVLAASEKKSTQIATKPLVVSGEVTHLGRSFLFAVRDGYLSEAEAIFLGMIDENFERRMAGDILFRAAIEDMGDGGHKLIVAVKLWQLARSLGFKDARTILRPAVQYLVAGERDPKPFRTIMAVLGKEWVDLESLATGGRAVDDAGRAKVAALLATPTEESCVAATLSLLREDYAASSIGESLVAEAAKRTIAADGYDLAVAHGLIFAHAARSVLSFTRTSERLYGLFQAALRLRSPAAAFPTVSFAEAPGEGEELCSIAGELEARKPIAASARVHSYLSRRYSTKRLLETLAHYASRDSALVNQGHNIILADVCATEFTATKAPEVAMALAKMIAASPADWTAYVAWTPLLGV